MSDIFSSRENIKPYPLNTRYLVNIDGEITDTKRNKTCEVTGNRYYMVSINKIKTYLHRILAETFIPNSKGYSCVNHIDGNKLNNSLDNLEWISYRGNLAHARNSGLNRNFGQTATNSKLTDNQVEDIKLLYSTGNLAQHQIASMYNVHQVHISRIVNNKRRNAIYQ